MTFEYLREYRTYFHIANSYGVSESYAYKIIRLGEDTLIQSGEFSLPDKRSLYDDKIDYDIVLMVATETHISKTTKKQKVYYSGKKKIHTLKTQVVVNKADRSIICLFLVTVKNIHLVN